MDKLSKEPSVIFVKEEELEGMCRWSSICVEAGEQGLVIVA
jgi:hypothetical protein